MCGQTNSTRLPKTFAGREAAGCIPGTFTLVATYFGGGYVVGLGAEAYSSGMIAWYNGLAGAVGILAVCLVLKRWRESRLYTVAELLETRYGSPLRFPCAMLSLLALIGILSGQVNSAGVFCLPSESKSGCGRSNRRLLFIGYTVVGGLWAVTITDFIQIIVAGAGIIAATFFTVNKLGLEQYGRGGELADFRKLFYHDPGVEPSYILYLILPMFIYTLIGQDVYQRLFAAKDTKTAKRPEFSLV